MQFIATILFFYVFGLGAILMTYYVVRTVIPLIQISREQQKKPLKSPTEIKDEPIKLHISEGLIQVNRLPEEEERA